MALWGGRRARYARGFACEDRNPGPAFAAARARATRRSLGEKGGNESRRWVSAVSRRERRLNTYRPRDAYPIDYARGQRLPDMAEVTKGGDFIFKRARGECDGGAARSLRDIFRTYRSSSSSDAPRL